MMIAPGHYVALSAILFTIGGVGFLVRRNVLFTLMSIEVMLNAVNVALVAFNRMRPTGHGGQIFAFFTIATAAAEAAIGLAIVLSLYRLKRTVRSDEADLLKY
jgi:NADH-quinone oxidoreductase subunit K